MTDRVDRFYHLILTTCERYDRYTLGLSYENDLCSFIIFGLSMRLQLSLSLRKQGGSWFPQKNLSKEEFEQLINHLIDSHRLEIREVETDIILSDKLLSHLKLSGIEVILLSN